MPAKKIGEHISGLSPTICGLFVFTVLRGLVSDKVDTPCYFYDFRAQQIDKIIMLNWQRVEDSRLLLLAVAHVNGIRLYDGWCVAYATIVHVGLVQLCVIFDFIFPFLEHLIA